MSRIVALVILPPENAAVLREAVESDPMLRERIEVCDATGEAVRDAIPDAEIVVCGHLSPEMLAVAPKLRWLHFWSAGMDNKVRPDMLERRLLLTNSSGVHGPNISEHVFGFMLMFSRQLHFHLRSQDMGVWQRKDGTRAPRSGELAGQTLGIVGLGRIGEALAARAKAFEMRVLAVKREVTARYNADVVPDALYPLEELPRLLAESDHVCICLPYTPQTHHLFDAAMLAHIKPTAYFYNIARGKIVDEDALIEALRAGKLAGAGMDVFETEPLPEDSPLWKMENVLITPHVSGVSPQYFERVAALFVANLKHYLQKEPLHNLYDPQRGY